MDGWMQTNRSIDREREINIDKERERERKERKNQMQPTNPNAVTNNTFVKQTI